jgi:hypothetical protein
MKKQIILLVAVAGLAAVSAQAQGYCTGVTDIADFSNNGNEPAWVPVNTPCQMLPPPTGFAVTQIPEPSSFALCAIGLASLTVARRSFRPKA